MQQTPIQSLISKNWMAMIAPFEPPLLPPSLQWAVTNFGYNAAGANGKARYGAKSNGQAIKVFATVY